ncbi:hypothetical protein PG994_005441 [Apiospora phragmitis]|uniref:Uncharacterized protein n=1 Tax=Apiospora phragmitis TaxID=2905665 RepID=A0ABR1VF18_9PEZI
MAKKPSGGGEDRSVKPLRILRTIRIVIFQFLFLGANQALAECVEGHRVKISPGHTVEYKCDIGHAGDRYTDIPSEQACAEICRDAERSVCTYHPPTKHCIAGNECGRDQHAPGAIYMMKVDSDGDLFPPKELFPADAGAERDACLQRESALQSRIDQCQVQVDQYEAQQDYCPSSKPNPQSSIVAGGKTYKVYCNSNI